MEQLKDENENHPDDNEISREELNLKDVQVKTLHDKVLDMQTQISVRIDRHNTLHQRNTAFHCAQEGQIL